MVTVFVNSGDQTPDIPLFETVGNTVASILAPLQIGFGVLNNGVLIGFCRVTTSGSTEVQLFISMEKFE